MTKSKTNKNTQEQSASPAVEQEMQEPKAPVEPDADPRDLELADLKNQLVRLQADFDNHRKRQARERQDTIQQALADFMLELLPVLDNLDRGRNVALEHHADQAIKDGFEMIISQLNGLLERFSLVPVKETVGKPFDPNAAEAVSYLPSEEHPEGIVIAETRRGYWLHGRLLRAAQVVVSSGSVQTQGSDTEQTVEFTAEG